MKKGEESKAALPNGRSIALHRSKQTRLDLSKGGFEHKTSAVPNAPDESILTRFYAAM